jgi:hypothetical protein
MDQTFDKQKVVLASTQAIAWVKAERSRKLKRWNALSGWDKFCEAFFGGEGKGEYFESRRLSAAERLIFKASYCEDSIVFLSNDEIDQIRDFWTA